jgi:hypothetical protein
MKLLTSAQRAKLLDNGRRRQAAVKGTPGEIDLHPVVKLFNPCGAATGRSSGRPFLLCSHFDLLKR